MHIRISQRFKTPKKMFWITYTICKKIGVERSYYQFCHAIFAFLSGNSKVQEKFFPQQLHKITKLLDNTQIKTQTPRQALKTQILENTIVSWKYVSGQGKYSHRELKEDFEINHWEWFEQATETKRGIIFALSHYGLGRVFYKYMYSNGYLIRALPLPFEEGTVHPPKHLRQSDNIQNSVDSLALAISDLQQGNLIYILPDGVHGKISVTLPFFGIQRQFRTGFAKLALLSNAIVMPVTVISTKTGKICITFHEPLKEGPKDTDGLTQEYNLTQQYANYLEELWKDAPGHISEAHYYRFLRGEEAYTSKASLRAHSR